MYATATELGDPQAVAYVTWTDGITRNAVMHRRGRGPRDPAPAPHRARPLAGRARVPLGRERTVHIAHVLRLPAGVAGLVRASTRTGGHPEAGARSRFLLAGMASWAMLGRGEDTSARLRAARDGLADQPDNRGAWMAYIGAALMAAVEQSQLGEEFENVVADMRRIRLNPRRVWPVLAHHVGLPCPGPAGAVPGRLRTGAPGPVGRGPHGDPRAAPGRVDADHSGPPPDPGGRLPAADR